MTKLDTRKYKVYNNEYTPSLIEYLEEKRKEEHPEDILVPKRKKHKKKAKGRKPSPAPTPTLAIKVNGVSIADKQKAEALKSIFGDMKPVSKTKNKKKSNKEFRP